MTRNRTTGIYAAVVTPVLLVVLAAISQELGAAVAVTLFDALGPIGAVFARLAVCGVVLCAVLRPRIRGLSGSAWRAVLGLAVALTVMNVCFYLAIERIPLGVAVTVEVLGPLVLSVALSSRRSAWLWAVLAFVGVALLGLSQQRFGGVDPVGIAFAAAAALAWAGYIPASARAGAEFDRLDGLALASALGALALAPVALAVVDRTTAAHWPVLGLAVLVGMLSSVLPYSLELISLRRLAAETFAILTAISPATAAVAGWLVLGQRLGLGGWVAIGLVSVACVGAVRSAHTGATVGGP